MSNVAGPSTPRTPSLSSEREEQPARPPPSRITRIAHKIIGYDSEAPDTVGSSDYLKELAGSPGEGVKDYFRSLFPFVRWLPNYNGTWLISDLIAGITVGMVLVPQSMSYARLAGLRPEFGLYSSFIGVTVYAFFATSKDVSIGPVAVMSLETGRIVADVMHSHPGQWAAEQIATHVAFICGFIVLGIGLLRLGWLVEFIPVPAVAGFMTGSAISIAAGQVPALFGIANRLNTREATYHVIINTLKNLGYTKLDAAFGLPCLVGLYAIKWTCTYVEKKYPRWKRTAFFVSVCRNAFIVIVATLVSWSVTRHQNPTAYSISILKTVPSGFRNVGAPKISASLIGAFAGKIPVATIILLLEHISIAKSFGRINNYKIDPNQELVAIGVTNTFGTLFNAYPATGSFSRSALKSKSGVRTPAAGWPTALCVIIALYALTDAFYFIPNAALAAIIIHAVADLVVSPKGAYAFWQVSPLEFLIWLAAVLVTVFTTIENGIYTSLAASLVLLLFRIARPGGHFLGRVKVGIESRAEEGHESSGGVPGVATSYREVYLPLETKKTNIANPRIKVEPPPEGVVIYRFEQSFIYPNASYHNSALVDYVKAHTRRGKDITYTKVGDRPWNDAGPNRWNKKAVAAARLEAEGEANGSVAAKPLIRAIVLDFAAVANLDTTGVQNLVDTRQVIERWADGPVSFHFSGVVSPWVQRALVAGGFGGNDIHPDGSRTLHQVANVVPNMDIQNTLSVQPIPSGDDRPAPKEVERYEKTSERDSTSEESSLFEPLVSLRTPFIHFDLEDAVRAATAEAARANRR